MLAMTGALPSSINLASANALLGFTLIWIMGSAFSAIKGVLFAVMGLMSALYAVKETIEFTLTNACLNAPQVTLVMTNQVCVSTTSPI